MGLAYTLDKPWQCPKCAAKFHKGFGKGTHLRFCGTQPSIFWEKVHKPSKNGCWLYKGSLSFEGYGRFNIRCGATVKQYQAHRYSWLQAGKKLPKGALLLHHCDVRNCVNPAHLYIGTRTDNIRDAMKRGRYNHRYTPIDKLLWPQLSRRVKRKQSDAAEEGAKE